MKSPVFWCWMAFKSRHRDSISLSPCCFRTGIHTTLFSLPSLSVNKTLTVVFVMCLVVRSCAWKIVIIVVVIIIIYIYIIYINIFGAAGETHGVAVLVEKACETEFEPQYHNKSSWLCSLLYPQHGSAETSWPRSSLVRMSSPGDIHLLVHGKILSQIKKAGSNGGRHLAPSSGYHSSTLMCMYHMRILYTHTYIYL